MKNDQGNFTVHFIGAGGISVSALAKWCLAMGIDVSGSDSVLSASLLELAEKGARVYSGTNCKVATQANLVVYSSAIALDNPELVAARNAGIPLQERHIFLGKLAENFQSVIAVSGTHGKTTVTSLISAIFKNAGKSFTAHIGGEALDTGGNFYTSGNDFLVTEACEYKKNFLSLYPETAVILNVESDHPDCYESIEALYGAFAEFVENVQNNGFIVINENVEYLKLHIPANVHILKFGYGEEADVRAVNIIECGGICEYDLMIRGKLRGHVRPNLYGRHNVLNSLAALAVADLYGVDMESAVKSLQNFKGVKRRFESVAEVNGARIISDYAHHPSEIAAVISTAKSLASNDVKVFFQPHTYSRTAKYFKEFSNCFSEADDVSLLPTYPAREAPDMGKSAFDLFFEINKYREASYFENFVEAAAQLIKKARPGDIVLILGAGDIVEMVKLL